MDSRQHDRTCPEASERDHRLRADASHRTGSNWHWRPGIRGQWPQRVDIVEQQLKNLVRRMQGLRRPQKSEKTETLANEIMKAWRSGNVAEMHRIRVALSGTGKGPKKEAL
eukprot:2591793-Pyramimonas_sp.AAC.1